MSLSFSQMAAAAGDFQPLPPGTYDFVISSAKPGKSQNGKVQFQARIRVQGGPKDNQTVLFTLTLSPENENALFMFFRQMASIGLDKAFFASVPDGDAGAQVIAEAMVGRKFTAEITHRTWNGQTRENVGNIRAIVGGASAPPAPAGAGVPAGVPAPPAPATSIPPPPTVAAPAPVAPAVDPTTAPPPAPPVVDPATAPPPPPPAPVGTIPPPAQAPAAPQGDNGLAPPPF